MRVNWAMHFSTKCTFFIRFNFCLLPPTYLPSARWSLCKKIRKEQSAAMNPRLAALNIASRCVTQGDLEDFQMASLNLIYGYDDWVWYVNVNEINRGELLRRFSVVLFLSLSGDPIIISAEIATQDCYKVSVLCCCLNVYGGDGGSGTVTPAPTPRRP